MFIPHVVHEAIGVLAAVSVATACITPDTVTEGIANYLFQKSENSAMLSIEHPSGEFTVNLEYEAQNSDVKIKKSGVIRTARLLSIGHVFISE
jgi:4-oxalomesaconate tautomerase